MIVQYFFDTLNAYYSNIKKNHTQICISGGTQFA